MRTRKIRKVRSILKQIEQWKSSILELDLDNLKSAHREYAKIRVSPYSDLTLGNSSNPEPSGEVRKKILEALLDTYNNWKLTLDELGEPYYLKIWLYDNRFSNSQVVCAIGSMLDFYEKTFHKPGNQKEIDLSSYGSLSEQMKELIWQYAWDEEHYNNTSIGDIEEYATENDFYATRRWFNKRLKKPHRIINSSNPESEIKEYYSFRYGTVWIGGKD